ncbi:Lnb N-terminal periplasmic domain-containing protein [Acinetobacter pecorum]|uniref:Lnb N-terminal periplasmic domain-containing protein n=1 Tax=Acinetobacter pecorum TaxID=2762215 RepID=UPI003EE52E0B
MKYAFFVLGLTFSPLSFSSEINSDIQHYLVQAETQHLDQSTTWQRLMYANPKGHSEVSYSGYFLAEQGKTDLKKEMQHNIQALFLSAEPNQSVRCKFPARSSWLMQQLDISEQQLPAVSCPDLEKWLGEVKPYQATLIYATDFMGNPSSMFGHTLLRLDPKDQQQLNLISYAVNYAATVNSNDNWSFAWKGLTGQYPGEYSLMPYYRKVKEYGDFESRDLWEYELNLSPQETRFLVQHLWEMQNVSFPYYFINDNCSYRLLGLFDLVRPELNLQKQFNSTAIPIETLKVVEQQGLVKQKVYRPALETQLLAQSRQHGKALAKSAHQLAYAEADIMPSILQDYSAENQAKILEMAYDHLYLDFLRQKVDESFPQPRFRKLLGLRSQLNVEKQRKAPKRPKTDPVQSHHAHNISIQAGQVQGESFIQLGHRQAYHDLVDPQGGFRTGTQLLFLDGALQYRDSELKLEHLDLLTVNSYNPINPFNTPLSWGFNLGWQQEALDAHGRFSENEQHGVASLKTQVGYSWANASREHLCYAQMQTQLQVGKALDQGWRVGAGPTVGCQNIWSDHMNSLVQVELPYWEDSHHWHLKLNTQLQYAFNPQHALRLSWTYQQQQSKDWDQWSLGLIRYF